MKDVVLEGPPWAEFVEPDAEYVRTQGASVGSGALFGWSQANLGGEFEERSAADVRAELRALVRGGAYPVTASVGKP